ncbi:HlyD family secretion protein [Photobacterium nomapromontoriensis]|uniref:HlyD family secretion protein n=1 Tax=Photobacterium nomapromontoriensis TaxID=2910237 RepID=UPI003D0CACE6
MSKLKSSAAVMAAVVPVAALVGWLGYNFWLAYQPEPVRMQGQIDAQQYNISSKVPGRIEQVLVRKGDQVTQGELIFTLLSPEIDAKLEQAKAGEAAAGALAEQAEKGARHQEIAAAKDQWQKAKVAAALMAKTYKRLDNLYKDGVLSEQKRDEAYTQWQASHFTEQAAFQMFTMAQEGAREETKRAAFDKVRMAAGAVAEVEAYAADTQVTSWFDGEVTQILLHQGELAPQGFPVVSVVDINDAWAVFNVREDNLKNYPMGATFEAVIPALADGPHTFKVTHVAVLGDFATWRTTDPAQGFDMRTFEVEARPVTPIDGLRVGMSVIVE